MKCNITQTTLGELSVGRRGYYGLGAPAVPYSPSLYTYLRITDINDDGTLNMSDLKSVSADNASDYLLKINDIVFARTGASTGRNYFYDGTDGDFVFAGFLIKFSLDPSKVNPRYVKYYCQSKEYRDWIAAFNTGSTRGNINTKTLASMPIRLPDMETQHRIVNILDALENKRKNNKQINDNLQQHLNLLFFQIFTNIIPDIALGEVVETTSGGTPSRKHKEYYENGSICWIKSKELLGSYIHDTEEHINDLALSKSSTKMLPEHSVLIAMYGATVGAYGIISKQMTCNQAICALLSNENYPYTYLFQIAHEQQQNLINMAVGSAQQNISQALVKQLYIHSDIDAIKKFHKLAQPLHQQIQCLERENKTLSEVRDTLLPKLMSGELDVSELDI